MPGNALRILRLHRRFGSFTPFVVGLVALAGIFSGGIVGFHAIENYSLLESFYMVVITLSTVGFGEIRPLSPEGRLFTSLLILTGVGNFAFLVGSFTQVLVEGRLQMIWGRRRVQKTIDRLNDHIIVCGYGRIGSIAVREILREGLPVVAIEKDLLLMEKMETDQVLYIAGDATDDTILERAGIRRARSLITALSSEAANVYVTLIARQLRPDLRIVARADAEQHISRLELAGANRVMLPHILGGVRMAQSVVRPAVTSFLELAAAGDGVDLQMEELDISPGSELAGQSLVQSRIRQRFNLIVIAIKKADGTMLFNPGADAVLSPGDTMIVVGNSENLGKLQQVV